MVQPISPFETPTDRSFLEEALIRFINSGRITQSEAADINEFVHNQVVLLGWDDAQIWDAVGKQVGLLETGRRQAIGAEMTRAEKRRRGVVSPLEPNLPPGQPTVEPRISPAQAETFDAFLEGLSPNMARFFRGKLGGIFTEFEKGRPPTEEVITSGDGGGSPFLLSPATLREQAVTRERIGAPGIEAKRGQLFQALLQQQDLAQGALKQVQPGEVGAVPLVEQDPWKAFLTQYPAKTEFSREFFKQAPRQRGFFPSKFRPITRFLNF